MQSNLAYQGYAVPGRTVEEIFGYPDDLKFGSSMTLFASVAEGGNVYREALDKYFGGEPDSATCRGTL